MSLFFIRITNSKQESKEMTAKNKNVDSVMEGVNHKPCLINCIWYNLMFIS